MITSPKSRNARIRATTQLKIARDAIREAMDLAEQFDVMNHDDWLKLIDVAVALDELVS